MTPPQQWDTYEDWERDPLAYGPRLGGMIPTCFDVEHRIVRSWMDFQHARQQNAFPVRWLWPEDVAKMAKDAATMRAAIDYACDVYFGEGLRWLADWRAGGTYEAAELRAWRESR